MKKSYLIIAIMMMATIANAMPAKPGLRKLKAPDGTTIEAQLVGDEYHHCMVSSDGYIVKKVDGDFYQKSNERYDAAVAAEKREAIRSQRNTGIETKSVNNTTTNYASKGLVILVSFSDLAFTKTNAQFSQMLNQQGYSASGATGSAKDYFKATSYNKYNPTFDVYGPYTLNRTMSYYGQNDTWTGSDAHADQMIVDAVAKLVQAEGSNVLAQYDCDNDGFVDNVFVFYAGYAESYTDIANQIWPHRWNIFDDYVTGTLTYGGKTIYDYACASELYGGSGSTITGIAPFCHEFSHVLGLPDLYCTDSYSSGTFATPDEWDIMDGGCYNNDQRTPPLYSAQEMFYVGWLTPQVIDRDGTYNLDTLCNGTGHAYMITSTGKSNLNPTNPSPATYYLLENRQKKGWDAYLPGHGMLVWRINYSSSKWYNNTVNNSPRNLGCTIIAAGGNQKSGGYYVSSSSDPFPGTRRITNYSPYTNYSISQITENQGKISFVISTNPTGIEDATDDEPVIIREKVIGGKVRIDRLKEGMTVTIVDAMGRVLMQEQATGNSMEFDAPEVIYYITFAK